MEEWIQQYVGWTHLISTLSLVLIVILVRALVIRHIRVSEEIPHELKRRSIVQTRNLAFLAIFFGLIVIWASQLQVVAISVVAIAAAIVIATKELIMCLTGTVVRVSGHTFSIGDRIEVNGMRGDVIDQTLLTTTLLEIGPGQLTHQHTGRVLVLPNSVFLTAVVANETFTDEYVLHLFIVPMKPQDDWRRARQLLLQAARSECESFLDDASRHIEKVTSSQGLYTPSTEPRVTLQFPEPDRVNLMVRIPVPARRRGRIEQAILDRFTEQWSPEHL